MVSLFYILQLLSSPKIFVLTWDSLASHSPKFRRKARERKRDSSNALLLVRYKVSIQHGMEGVGAGTVSWLMSSFLSVSNISDFFSSHV